MIKVCSVQLLHNKHLETFKDLAWEAWSRLCCTALLVGRIIRLPFPLQCNSQDLHDPVLDNDGAYAVVKEDIQSKERCGKILNLDLLYAPERPIILSVSTDLFFVTFSASACSPVLANKIGPCWLRSPKFRAKNIGNLWIMRQMLCSTQTDWAECAERTLQVLLPCAKAEKKGTAQTQCGGALAPWRGWWIVQVPHEFSTDLWQLNSTYNKWKEKL